MFKKQWLIIIYLAHIIVTTKGCTLFLNLQLIFFQTMRRHSREGGCLPQGYCFSYEAKQRQELSSSVLVNLLTFKSRKINKKCLATKVIHSKTLAHENIDHNHSSCCFPPTIRIRIPFYTFSFQECLQHSKTAIIDESRNMFYMITVT